MKRLFLLAFVMLSLSASAQFDLKNLERFIGTWKAADSPNFEVWEKVNDSLYTGNSYELDGKEKILKEVLYLEKRNDSVIYTATVFHQNNGKPVSFILTTNLPKTFSFENEKHDFPKKIQYHFIKQGKLEIRLSGSDGKSFVLNLEKIK